MEQLEFEDYEELAENISDTFDFIEDEYDDISVIAKYDEAKEIIKELLSLGYDIASLELYREEFENYYDEYLISLNFDGVWCEKFMRDSGYFKDESHVIYIMDNCSSAVIPYCKSENVYEISVNENVVYENFSEYSEPEHEYTVNGKKVDKETFDNYVSQFAPDMVNKEENNPAPILSATYKINGREVSKDAYESELSKIEDVYLNNMRDMLLGYAEFMDEMNEWRKLFCW